MAPSRGVLSPTFGRSLHMRGNICSADSMIVNCRYVLPLQTLSGAALRSSIRLTSNAYDVDSALASTAMAGFGEYALLYARFRTMSMSYEVTMVNKEAFAVSGIVGFQNTSIASGSLGANYTENPYNQLKLMGTVNGNNVARFKGKASIPAMTGSKQAIFDDLFTGSTTSSTLATAGTCWLYFGAEGSANLTNGVDVQGWVTLQIEMYRRGSLIGQPHEEIYTPPHPSGVQLKRYGPHWQSRQKHFEHMPMHSYVRPTSPSLTHEFTMGPDVDNPQRQAPTSVRVYRENEISYDDTRKIFLVAPTTNRIVTSGKDQFENEIIAVGGVNSSK